METKKGVKKKKIAIVTGGNESTVVSEGGTMLAGGCCEDHKAKVEGLVQDEDWFPPTRNKPVKPIQSDGDVTFCSTCKSNTTYKGLCSVCGIKSEEIRMKHEGNLKYLKVKYSDHVNVK
jgi:hypothetical protein